MLLLRKPNRAAAVAALAALCCVAAGAAELGRKALVPPPVPELRYKSTGIRLRADPSTHQLVEYAVDGKITRDQREGTYVLEWTGADGERKKLIYVLANKVRAQVAGAAAYNAKGHSFEFSYEISSLAKSEQRLQSLYIVSESPVLSGTSPDDTWYSSRFTPFLRELFKVEDGWTWSQTRVGRLGLEPSETAKGFRLYSSGVPTIVNCYVRGYTEPLRTSEEVPEELLEAFDGMTWSIPHGVTIGPGLPPEKLTKRLIVQNLSRALQVSYQQGWFAGEFDRGRVEKLLAEIGTAVDSSNGGTALGLQEEILRLVDAGFADGLLLSEGHDLFALNLEVLRDKISRHEPVPAKLF